MDAGRLLEIEGPTVPARAWAGMRRISIDRGRSRDETAGPPQLRDHLGRVVPGALAILADTSLGMAVMSQAPDGTAGMATTHLHLELLQPIPKGDAGLYCEGRAVWLEDDFGLGEGGINCGDTAVARATLGCLLMERKADFRPTEPTAGPTASSGDTTPGLHPLIAGSPVYQALDAAVVSAGDDGVTLSVRAKPELANSSRGVHGGIGVLIGERTLDLALRAALTGKPAHRMRPVELRAAFLRPIPADGSRIRSHAQVAHLGRRLAATRGEVRDQLGRTAVVIDATYVAY